MEISNTYPTNPFTPCFTINFHLKLSISIISSILATQKKCILYPENVLYEDGNRGTIEMKLKIPFHLIRITAVQRFTFEFFRTRNF